MRTEILRRYNFIKENISLILIVPSVIGGLWQLFELSSINTGYIRFFSISQVVPDGLLILFLVSLIILSFYAGGAVIKFTSFYKAEMPDWSSAILILILFGGGLAYTAHTIYNDINQNEHIRISQIAIILFEFTFTLGSFIHLIPHKAKNKFIDYYKKSSQEKENNLEKRNEKSIKTFFKKIIGIILILSILYLFFLTLNILGDLRLSYIKTENLINIQDLKEQLVKTNNGKKFDEILYFNDKYFFIQLSDAKNEKFIKIIETSSMLR